MNIRNSPLSYAQNLDIRDIDAIDLAVIHCTELPDLATAREYGEKIHYPGSTTGNSGHYYIDRDGSVHCWVPLERIAHHAGNYNARSVGIELVNRGRWPDWFNSNTQIMTEPYPAAQVESLLGLLSDLRIHLRILRWITGHEDLDQSRIAASDAPGKLVKRKLDPGPEFPWPEVLSSSGLGRLEVHE